MQFDMKKLLFLFALLIACSSATAQVDSLTYGITSLKQGPGLFLSKINASDGNVTNISVIAVPRDPGAFGRTIDPLHHVFYYLNGTDLLAFNIKTGDLIRSITVINFRNSTFEGIAYNYRDSSLYGLTVDAAAADIRLAKLDPFTGSVTPVSDSSLANSCSILTGTALDPVHGVYYFQSMNDTINHLLAIDIHSGRIISDFSIGVNPGETFGPMEYNCRDSSLYGLTGNFIMGRKLSKINLNNGELTILSKFPLADTILNEYVTIDSFNGVFYFEAIDHTSRGVNITSGDLVSMIPITAPEGSFFTGFIFNYACYVHPPSSIDETDAAPRLSVFPNPVSGILNICSTEPLIKIEILDFTGRLVFAQDCRGLKDFSADLSGFGEGLYILRMNTVGSIVSRELVKVSPGFGLGK